MLPGQVQSLALAAEKSTKGLTNMATSETAAVTYWEAVGGNACPGLRVETIAPARRNLNLDYRRTIVGLPYALYYRLHF